MNGQHNKKEGILFRHLLKLCVYNEKNEVLINVYKRIGLPL